MEYRKRNGSLVDAREPLFGPRVIHVRRAPALALFGAQEGLTADEDATEPYDLELCEACGEIASEPLCDSCFLAIHDPDRIEIQEDL